MSYYKGDKQLTKYDYELMFKGTLIENSIIKGDCIDIMSNLKESSIDLILVDPPYGTTACKWDSVIDFNSMWHQIVRVLKDDGIAVIFGTEPFSTMLRMSNIKMFKYDLVWVKNTQTGIALSKTQPMRKHELISVFYNKNGTYNKQENISKSSQVVKNDGKFRKGKNIPEHTGGMVCGENVFKASINPSTVLNFDVVPRATGTLHPTQKPVKLIEYLVKTYSNEGETVLDFTMGSGTTGVACLNTGRRFIGIELDSDYFNIANNRIMNEVGSLLNCCENNLIGTCLQ